MNTYNFRKYTFDWKTNTNLDQQIIFENCISDVILDQGVCLHILIYLHVVV